MNKIIISLAFFILSTSVFAAPYGRIVEVKGEGFISHNGKTKDIRVGDIIEMDSEIVVEHAGQVTFTDNADHRYHIGNSSSVAVFQKNIELRSGDMWIQSINRIDDYKVSTANAEVFFQGGEAVLSYDTVKGKTQLMVISGLMKLGNLRAPELNLSIAEGHFSFIDNAYDEGAPRDPTPVGEKTYRQLISLFKNVAPLEKNAVMAFKQNDNDKGRTIASVAISEDKALEEYKAKILTKKPEDVKQTLTEAKIINQSPVGKKAPAKTVTFTPLVVKIYGLKSAASTADVPVMKNRAPASVLETPVPVEINHSIPNNNEHYKESEKLINQLQQL